MLSLLFAAGEGWLLPSVEDRDVISGNPLQLDERAAGTKGRLDIDRWLGTQGLIEAHREGRCRFIINSLPGANCVADVSGDGLGL